MINKNSVYNQYSEINNAITMQDVWLNGLLIHLLCILTIDLFLPQFVYKTLLKLSKLLNLSPSSTSLLTNLILTEKQHKSKLND